MRAASSVAATRRARSSSGASTTRGKRHAAARFSLDDDGWRIGRGPPEPERLEPVASVSASTGRDRQPHELGRGRGSARRWPGCDREGDASGGAEKLRSQQAIGSAAGNERPALWLPAELTGQPGRQPDRHPGRTGRIGRQGLDLHRVDPAQALGHGTSGSKNCATSSRQRASPNQALSRLHGQRAGSSPRRSAPAVGAGIGQVEDQARAFVGQVAEQCLVLPRVARPPEHHRQVGLEQRPDGAGNQVDRIRPGPQHDPLGADLRHALERASGKAPTPRRRFGALDRPTRAPTIARHGNRAITVSSTGPNDSRVAVQASRRPGWPARCE